jgi:hypothetical protein
MVADSDSRIAWHRAQLKKHRQTLKALETTRFTAGDIAGPRRSGASERTIAELKRKIAQSERCIAEYERRTRRPLTTDLQSLASVSWGHWDGTRGQPRKGR